MSEINEKAAKIKMDMSEAIRTIQMPPLFEALLDAINVKKPPSERIEAQRRAQGYYYGLREHFQMLDNKTDAAVKEATQKIAEYEKVQGQLNHIPRSHIQRGEFEFKAGALWIVTSMAHSEAKRLVEKLPKLMAAINFVSKLLNENLSQLGELIGDQKGPTYFRGPDAKYSGPQNPPLRPSGDKDFIMSESECWCVYCNSKVNKSSEDLLKPCENLVCSRCGRMLGSKVTMPNDKRVYDYGQLKKRPHT